MLGVEPTSKPKGCPSGGTDKPLVAGNVPVIADASVPYTDDAPDEMGGTVDGWPFPVIHSSVR